MPLTRRVFAVFVLESPDEGEAETITEHRLEISFADQLRGELEAPRHGITTEQPMHLATVWAWCAMTRLGLYTKPYQEFKTRDLVDLDRLEDAEVDPTQPGRTASPSS